MKVGYFIYGDNMDIIQITALKESIISPVSHDRDVRYTGDGRTS